MKHSNIFWMTLFILFAISNIANGVWMLVRPFSWYTDLPALVPDFGPLNEHFIRDLGCMFITYGLLSAWAVLDHNVRRMVLVTLTLWYSLHAMVHAGSTAIGIVSHQHWKADAPLVYVPTLILALSLLYSKRLKINE